jgi:hypothetical protein
MKLRETIEFVKMSDEDRKEFADMNRDREKRGLSPWSREKFLSWKTTHYKEKYKRGE